MPRLALLAALFLVACPRERIVASDADLVIETSSVEFGDVWLGFPATRPMTLRNAARTPLELALSADAPFHVAASLTLAPGETQTVDVVLEPAVEGEATTSISVRWDANEHQVPAHALIHAVPQCRSPGDCRVATFDPVLGACRVTVSPNGAACGADDRCQLNARCVSGECLGQRVDCDDRNACTQDVCDPASGCRHDDLSALCPPSDLPCQVAVCSPATGCGLGPTADGTSCGPNDCLTAKVCVAGRCDTRTPPEGSVCAPEVTCRGAGVCRGQSCELPPIGAPRVAWRYTPAAGRVISFQGIRDRDGSAYFLEADTLGGNMELVSVDRDGTERFREHLPPTCRYCLYYVSVALDPDLLRVYLGFSGGAVQARSALDGSLLWQNDLSAGIVIAAPLPDGGPSIYQPNAYVLDGGVAFALTEGYEDHRSYLMGLDPSSGQKLWQVYRKGHFYNPGATDTLWISSANCWAPAGDFERFDVAGNWLAGRFIQGIPTGYSGSLSYMEYGVGPRLIDQQLVETRLTLPNNQVSPYDPALMSSGRLFLPATVAGPVVSAPVIDAFDLTTLQLLWTARTPQLRSSLDLQLGSQGEIFGAGSALDGGGLFYSVDSTGAQTLQCQLPNEPGSPISVARERYVVQQGGALVGYVLPGSDATWTGWSVRDGNLGHDRHVR